jgi:NADPH-dependent ferric siderophore reductase
MRRELIARGFPKQQISAEGYWRPGRVGGHDHVDDEHA